MWHFLGEQADWRWWLVYQQMTQGDHKNCLTLYNTQKCQISDLYDLYQSKTTFQNVRQTWRKYMHYHNRHYFHTKEKVWKNHWALTWFTTRFHLWAIHQTEWRQYNIMYTTMVKLRMKDNQTSSMVNKGNLNKDVNIIVGMIQQSIRHVSI